MSDNTNILPKKDEYENTISAKQKSLSSSNHRLRKMLRKHYGVFQEALHLDFQKEGTYLIELR